MIRVVSALPLHPAVNHFPVVASLLAVCCLGLGLRSPGQRAEWALRAQLLLAVAVLALPVVLGSGRLWSVDMGLWPWRVALPPSRALNGMLGLHVLGAALSAGLLALGLVLTWLFRRGRIGLWPVLLVALAAALATGITARVGGQMAFGEPAVQEEP